MSLRIDFHTHIIPPHIPDFAKAYGGERWPTLDRVDEHTANIMVQGKVFRKITNEAWDPAKRIERMNLEQVDKQVLSAIPITFCYWAPIQSAIEFARLQNDFIAETVEHNRARFMGLGTVPLQEVDAAIAEMDRCVHQLKLSGLQIGSNVNGIGLDDASLAPFFEHAERWNVPLFIHPYEAIGNARTASDNFAITVGMPMEMALTASRLVWSGFFEKYPRIKVCLAHGGGAFPYILPRVDTGWNSWPALRKSEQPPSAYANRFYYDALVYDPKTTKFLIDLVGYDRVIMGTDYPFIIKETPPGKAIMETEGISMKNREAMLGGNALLFLA